MIDVNEKLGRRVWKRLAIWASLTREIETASFVSTNTVTWF
jgi:hypothetical protein